MLVYVGAVMVLFLFVVMMLDINLDRLREGFWQYLPLGAVVAVVMVAQMVLVVGGKYFGLVEMPMPSPRSATFSNTKELGRLIYTDYVYPFELAAVVSAGGDRGCHRAHHAQAQGQQVRRSGLAGHGEAGGSGASCIGSSGQAGRAVAQ